METMSNTSVQQSGSKGLNVALWIAQIILAAMFMMSGVMKLKLSEAELASHGNVFPILMIRLIGICEIAGSIGLILPALLRIKPILTPWAAIGITTIMVLAFALHVSRREMQPAATTFVLGLLGVFIAWGRMKKVVIRPK